MSKEKGKRKIYKDLAISLVAAAVLIFVKVYIVENSYIGHWLNARGYEFLHSLISPFNPDKELSVVVLDISDMKREGDGTTPTKDLREIIEALIESQAKAIAIDIDFSPRIDAQNPIKTGFRAEDDPEFFDFLHEQKQQQGVPIFVGVHNIGPEPASWLAVEEYKDLAADMNIFDEDTTQVPRWLRCSDGEKLNSISMALAEASGNKLAPSSLLKRFLADPEAQENLKPTSIENNSGQKIPCVRAFTFVNYAKVELIQKLIVQAFNRASVLSLKDADGKSKFEKKLVIIGNGQRGKAYDTFWVIGHPRPVPGPVAGIYLHASAVYSLVDEPIYKFKHWATVVLDGFFSLILVFGLLRIQIRHHEDTQPWSHLWESLIILSVALLTFLLACFLVRFCDVIWLDFSLVIFAVLLHSKVQEWLLWIPTIIFRKKRPLPLGTE